MDGTVVDTGIMIAKTINHVRHHIGLEPMEPKQMLHNLNDPDINGAEFFYGTKHFTDEQTKLFEDYYHENCIVGVELYDGMKEFLKECSDKCTLTIATNAHTDFAHKILSHLDVHEHFSFVIGADKVKNPKPHPDMVEKTLQNFNFEKKNATLVGDSLKDKMAATSAGINYKLVNWGFTEHHKDEKVISNLEHLKKVLL
jgi:phosphoglycolate phosphatase